MVTHEILTRKQVCEKMELHITIVRHRPEDMSASPDDPTMDRMDVLEEWMTRGMGDGLALVCTRGHTRVQDVARRSSEPIKNWKTVHEKTRPETTWRGITCVEEYLVCVIAFFTESYFESGRAWTLDATLRMGDVKLPKVVVSQYDFEDEPTEDDPHEAARCAQDNVRTVVLPRLRPLLHLLAFNGAASPADQRMAMEHQAMFR